MTCCMHWRSAGISLLLLMAFWLSACLPLTTQPVVDETPVALAATPTVMTANTPPTATATTTVFGSGRPTATLPPEPVPQPGQYVNPSLGVTFTYPPNWNTEPGEDTQTLTWLVAPSGRMFVVVFYSPLAADTDLEEAAQQAHDSVAEEITVAERSAGETITLDDGRMAWRNSYSGSLDNGSAVRLVLSSTTRGGQLFTFMAFGPPDDVEREQTTLDAIVASVTLTAPDIYGLPRDQTLVQLGGESTNPRDYDPAQGSGDSLVFSGLVTFNPQLELVPDLAAGWDISEDGTVYTFYLRPNARFHDGRPVTAADVIYSWERAADPDTDSNTVLTYLGDIVGVKARHAGEATQISGLQALDDHTLQVTLEAPVPYFLGKLTYTTAAVVDRANVESGAEWYRTPNGTGPYRLIRWDRFQLQLYERNDDFYLEPPPIRFIAVQLYAGVGIRMYELGDIDMTGVSLFNVERVRDPRDPLHADLHEGVNMCTSQVRFDVSQAPFDDPAVRQAFALAVDRQTYLEVVLRGVGVAARGLYPPALPGFNPDLAGLAFDPEGARQSLAASTYGSADRLPPIVFTSSGFGSDAGRSIAALAQMWETHLGVTIQIENLEPNTYYDMLHTGEHGQLFMYGWCADYPDPENFVDVLFHSEAQQNLGNYANADLDALLVAARTEDDETQRLRMYQQAEQMIVDDAAAIFLNHSLSFVLVKPHIQNYVLTPIAVPLERYLAIDPALLAE